MPAPRDGYFQGDWNVSSITLYKYQIMSPRSIDAAKTADRRTSRLPPLRFAALPTPFLLPTRLARDGPDSHVWRVVCGGSTCVGQQRGRFRGGRLLDVLFLFGLSVSPPKACTVGISLLARCDGRIRRSRVTFGFSRFARRQIAFRFGAGSPLPGHSVPSGHVIPFLASPGGQRQ
jgi:hypothetical protein